MRIAVFTNAYKPYVSGVVRSISTFRKELLRQGHPVYVFAPEAPDYKEEDYDVFRYPGINLGTPIQFPIAIPVSPCIDWLVRRLRIDVIHSQHPMLLGQEAIGFSRKHHLPHVFTYHSQYEIYATYIVPFSESLVKRVISELLKYHMMQAQRIIAPTESIYQKLVNQYDEIADRFVVLPTPMDLSTFDNLKPEPIRARYDLDHGFTFVCVSRLTNQKNYPMLLKCFARATAEHPNTKLLIVGDGPYRKDLEKLVRQLSIERQVHFCGQVDYDEVPHYLAAGDAFAFASVTETQGLVTVEAMAAGLPVVAVDAPGNRDVVRHEENGLLTPVDEPAFTDALKRIIQEDSLRERLARGAKQTASQYESATVIDYLLEIYQEARREFERKPPKGLLDQMLEQARHFPPKWLGDF
jgi:1,2-diacylglycerol 3-alpha-glucosyltransferase